VVIGLGMLWHTQVIVAVITVFLAALAALGGGVFTGWLGNRAAVLLRVKQP
jgi:hypothetical protein